MSAGVSAENSAGKQVCGIAQIDDADGVSITVTLAATPQAFFGAAFAQAVNHGGGLSFDVATGRWSVAEPQARGRYRVVAGVLDDISANNAILSAFVSKNGTKASAPVRKVMAATAAREALGTVECLVDLDEVGDYVDLRIAVGTNGQAHLIRSGFLALYKVG